MSTSSSSSSTEAEDEKNEKEEKRGGSSRKTPTMTPIPRYPYNLTSLISKTILERGKISMNDVTRYSGDKEGGGGTVQAIVTLRRMVKEGLLSSRMNMSEDGKTEYREYFPTEKFTNLHKTKSLKDRERMDETEHQQETAAEVTEGE